MLNKFSKMLIETKAENKLMTALVENWFDEFSVYSLAKKANITNPLLYAILPKLIDKGVIIKKDKKIALNKDNLFVYRYKLLYDANKLLELSKNDVKIIEEIFTMVQNSYKVLNSFIIIGSLAGLYKEAGDFDFLVIGKKEKDINYHRIARLKNINLIEKTEEEIKKDFLATDDFLISCLSSNIVVYDDGTFRNLLQRELPFPSLEIINQRKEQLFKLEERIRLLLQDKDTERLIDEFKFFLIKKARIILLENNIIPLSKYHVLEEIKKIEPEIFKLYNAVNSKNVIEKVIKYV